MKCNCNTCKCTNNTGLKDILGNDIMVGNIVHWTDGGDDLPLSERIKTRWDRIAVVSKNGILPKFTVIDSPAIGTKNYRNTFCYGSFIYQETEKFLTVVAQDMIEYKAKFKSAGDCMAWVLEAKANKK